MNPLLFRLFRDNEVRVHELNYLFWECTTRCNLACRHCGSDCSIQSREKDMPLEDFLRAVDTIPTKERPANFLVVLTGGEPLLRPDIETVGRSIRERGMQWGLVSNGWFYDEQAHARLMGAGLGSMTISLDGLKGSHDWMRGRQGSFERATGAIRLMSADPRLTSDVVTCVHKRNLAELPELYQTLTDLGAKQWRLFTIIPIGRAASDPDMQLNAEELRQLMDFIAEKRQHPCRMKVTFSCEDYLGPYEEKVRDNRFFCHAGVNIASVLIDGRICACPNIDRDAFSQGNIYEDNLWEVWQTRFAEFRDRRWARRNAQCAECKHWRDCLGGGLHSWHDGHLLGCDYSSICESLSPRK